MGTYKTLNLKDIQDRTINQAIVVFFILGLIGQVFVIFRSIQHGFKLASFSGFIGVTFLSIICYFRHNLSTKIKVLILLGVIFLNLIAGLNSLGIVASAKYYIPIIPAFIAFITTYKNAILSLISFLLVYTLFGVLIITDNLIINVNYQDYTSNIYTWGVDLTIIMLTSWGLLFIGKNFRESLLTSFNEIKKHKNNLERLIEERTNELKEKNSELENTIKQLNIKSKIIEQQNKELKITLDQLKTTQSQLLHSEKMASLGILTAGVAHEINNPLNYIMGAYVGLQHNYTNKSFYKNYEETGVLIDALKTGVERSSEIVKGLNQFSRKTDSHDEDCNIHTIINNSIVMLNNKINNRIDIRKHFTDNNCIIKGNVSNLHQIFINLLYNAIQAVDEKGTISIETTNDDSNLIIIITDTGSGISNENLKKITDPFFTTKSPGEGTGLGLSITYNIIKEHNGKLLFESELGKGTIVKIILPQKI